MPLDRGERAAQITENSKSKSSVAIRRLRCHSTGGGRCLLSEYPYDGRETGSPRAWARPGSAIKTRAQRQLGRTEESDR